MLCLIKLFGEPELPHRSNFVAQSINPIVYEKSGVKQKLRMEEDLYNIRQKFTFLSQVFLTCLCLRYSIARENPYLNHKYLRC